MKKNVFQRAEYILPFAGLLVIVIAFSITTRGTLWTSDNLLAILSTIIPLILGGCGMIFVVAQGGCDLSVGSASAIAGTLAAIACQNLGFAAYIPTAILIGALIGLFNGVIVSHFKVQSIMVTLAMLIALRALVVYITNGSVIYVPEQVLDLNNYSIKIPVFLVAVLIMYFLFEYTKVGYFSKSIGENEMAAKYTGIPVNKYKIIAFILSGIMAGLVGSLNVGRIGGVDPTMGNFFELEVMIALFVGGVPVTGGSGSKIYRLFIGAITVSVLENGLTLSKVDAGSAELIEGIILIAVISLTLFIRDKLIQKQEIMKTEHNAN
ncbi:MAG TPA: hypothetical protein DCL86_14955 [Bacteroidales bacterium]|jgi:ribose transport system permease protein|nr:hypothetical protein [Bacteroidales bacterium]